MGNIFRTKTFWTALATGVTGILAACGIAEPVTQAIAWGFGSLTAMFLRAGVLKSEPRTNPFGHSIPRN